MSGVASAGPYADPKLSCDVVMKGGITSGVIYPRAICKIAERYRLHSIGGASAGAIASAAAAAAEYARHARSSRGFELLAALPAKLEERLDDGHGPTRLQSLFQPTARTRVGFEVLVAATGKQSAFGKVLRVVELVLSRHWVLPLVGACAATCLVAAAASAGAIAVIGAVIAGLVLVAAGIAGAAALAVRETLAGIEANYHGICRGYAPEDPARTPPPLCTWLADLIDDLAGRDLRGAPLTFADLAERDVELAMMTTCLTHARPYRLPFADTHAFWFSRREMAALFPHRVVRYLVERGEHALEHDAHLQRIAAHNGADYLPLPPDKELPVIVAARMSLSFPVLLSAIPLYAVDWSQVRHPDLEHGDLSLLSSRPHAELPPTNGQLALRQVVFSDGGICSNLPIHFFDKLLPTRPTFALDLQPPRPATRFWKPGDPGAGSEADNVYVPESPNAPYVETWNAIGAGAPALIGGVMDTMQNWSDNMLAKAPGYRDRVVRISHLDSEGGMNLDMDPEVIDRLAERGAAAGEKIANRFDPAVGNAMPAHVWVRYRTGLGMLQNLLADARAHYFVDPVRRADLYAMVDGAPAYHLDDGERAAAKTANTMFETVDLGGGVNFERRAPRPITELRVRPR